MLGTVHVLSFSAKTAFAIFYFRFTDNMLVRPTPPLRRTKKTDALPRAKLMLQSVNDVNLAKFLDFDATRLSGWKTLFKSAELMF